MSRFVLIAVPALALAAVVVWVLPRTGVFGKNGVEEKMPSGKQFFASPDGSPKGDGGEAAPWDLQTAFDHQPSLSAGDVLNLRAGTYRTKDGSRFICRLKGLEGKYILVRPYLNERVVIESGIEVDGPWVIVRDMEVASSNPDRVSEQNTSSPTDAGQVVGFNIFAPHVKIVNNFVHDNSAGLDSWIQAPDSEYYGNLIYYNGWTSGKRAFGHGLSMQNMSGAKLISDNVIFNQFGPGMQFYGSEKADLNNFDIEGNIVFNNGILNNEHSRNILIGGGKVAQNPVLKDNYMYFTPARTLGGDHNIGYYPFGVGCSGLKLTGNYIASDGAALNLFKCSVNELEDNTLYGEIKGFKREDYPDNEYFDRTAPPQGIHTFVRANRYEPGRANVAVFNWSRSATVSIDISGIGLEKGDTYEIHSAQDYFGDVKTGVFDGAPITVSMMDRSVAAPVGAAPPPSTFPEFGAFVIRKAAAGAAAASKSN